MYFQQFYLGCLAHASYLLGSDGVAVVVDPQRDVEIYLEDAQKQGLRIEHIVETHLHADFVSGHRELAVRTGARIYVGRNAGARIAHVPVKDGDVIRFGRCELRFETRGTATTASAFWFRIANVRPTPGPCSRATRFSSAKSGVRTSLRITRPKNLPRCSTTVSTRSC